MGVRRRWLRVSGVVILEYAVGAALVVLADLLILSGTRPRGNCVDTCWGAPLAVLALSALAGVVLSVGLMAALGIVAIQERRRMRAALSHGVETGRVLETATTAAVLGLALAIAALVATLVMVSLTAHLIR